MAETTRAGDWRTGGRDGLRGHVMTAGRKIVVATVVAAVVGGAAGAWLLGRAGLPFAFGAALLAFGLAAVRWGPGGYRGDVSGWGGGDSTEE